MEETWKPPRESEFTPPTELCPHPEWWTSWNHFTAEVEVSMLVAAFVKAMQPEFVLEIGAHYGQTTERIGKVIEENGHGKFISLEIDPDLCGSARSRCGGYPLEIINVNSLEYIPPVPIDILYVDGGEERSLDIEHFMPYLSEHALILVHDSDFYPFQFQRIMEYTQGWNHINLHTPRGLLIMAR